jgi:AcrR family transcriptional regulator
MAPSEERAIRDAELKARPTIRWPTQERSRRRFEGILDAADRLLERIDPADFSIYALAPEAGMSAPSIYHFFRSPALLLTALADRYLAALLALIDAPLPEGLTTWQDVEGHLFDRAREFFQAHAPARKLLLGAAYSTEIRKRDLNNDVQIAEKALAVFQQVFVLPASPGLLDRFAELIVINEAIWALSYHRHGSITEEMNMRARLARLSYGRTFLPEHLELRERRAPGSGR